MKSHNSGLGFQPTRLLFSRVKSWSRIMPTVVKQRLLDILNDVPETSFDLVSFYLDADIAPTAKQQKALFSLKHEIETLPLALPDFPRQLDQLEHWMIQHEQQAQLEFEYYLKR